MTVLVLAFAQTRDLLGFGEREVECTPAETPRELISRLAPSLACSGLRVALDGEYGSWDAPIGTVRELALIPPVSGG